MATFDDWTLEDAQGALNEANIERLGSDDAFKTNRAFLEDQDHWQDGAGWVGPNGGSSPEAQKKVLEAVKRQFTPRDAMGECLGRQANALLRREPMVDLVPRDGSEVTEEEQVRIDEAKAALATWWDRVKLWQLARKTVARSRWSTRGALRTWIASGHLEELKAETDEGPVTLTQLPRVEDLAEGLARVQLSAPDPSVAYVHTDEDTQERVAMFLFQNDDGEARAELWYLDGEETVVRVVGGEDEEQAPVRLGGRLPIVEMEADLLITEPVRAQQRRLNFAESLLNRVAETGGFPERYTLNAEPSGIWLDTKPTDGPALRTHTEGGKTWYLHPSARTLGAAITTDLVGVKMKSGEGESRATPGVVFKEPTDPEFAIKSARHAYRTILEECKQSHMAGEDTAEASGIAYQQARADYEDDLAYMKGAVEGLLRDTLEVAIAWAEAMLGGGSSLLEQYRVTVDLTVQSGSITPEEQEQNNGNVRAGTLSIETAMAQNGVEDVDAELRRIRESPESIVKLRKEQIMAIMEMAREGVPLSVGAQIVGITDPEELAQWEAAEKAMASPNRQENAQDREIDQILAGTGAGA